jgi:hypothetical protein
MAEWLKAAVLKTVSGVTRSGVRIPLPPPLALNNSILRPELFLNLLLHGAFPLIRSVLVKIEVTVAVDRESGLIDLVL